MSETGHTKSKKAAGDDKSNNFRPSPNFKHMKKYLKYKFEEAECTRQDNVDETHCSQNEQCKIKVVVQPPLPPDSPPPDCLLNFVLKKEIDDDEYERNSVDKSDEMEKRECNKLKVMDEKLWINPRKTMCKDFVRGSCKRGESCIFVHKLDVNQLVGVYKFCRDFENRKCKRPVCFFVHATTSEKEHFFRTGVLPPHTTKHLTEANMGQEGQPLNEGPMPVPGIQPIFINDYNAPQSTEITGCAPELRTGDAASAIPIMPISAGPPCNDSRLPPEVLQAPPLSPVKRDWTEFSGSAVRDNDVEPAPKKCLNCKFKKKRYQENKAKLESVKKSTQKLIEGIALLERRKTKLMSIMTMLLFKD